MASTLAPTVSPTLGEIYCPESSLLIDNYLVYITVGVGAISTLLCIYTLCLMRAFNLTKHSLRERILFGLFLGNLLFSVSNMVPYFQYQTQGSGCGNYEETNPNWGSLGPSLWYCGTYTMVGFEIFIVSVSIHSLRSGSVDLKVSTEWVCHFLSLIFLGFSAFFVFFFNSRHNLLILLDANARKTQEQRDQFNAVTRNFATLNSQMLTCWLAFICLVFALWAYQRIVLSLLMLRWKEAAEAAMLRRKPSYAQTPNDVMNYENSRKVLDLQKEAYIEIAKPLERYIIIFALFSPPAILMCVPYCIEATAHSSTQNVVNCDVVCMMLFAVRTIATISVYLRERSYCDELVSPYRVILLLHYRSKKSNTRFNSEAEVRLFEEQDEYVEPPSRLDSIQSTDSDMLGRVRPPSIAYNKRGGGGGGGNDDDDEAYRDNRRSPSQGRSSPLSIATPFAPNLPLTPIQNNNDIDNHTDLAHSSIEYQLIED